jgi:hypothetical protein
MRLRAPGDDRSRTLLAQDPGDLARGADEAVGPAQAPGGHGVRADAERAHLVDERAGRQEDDAGLEAAEPAQRREQPVLGAAEPPAVWHDEHHFVEDRYRQRR